MGHFVSSPREREKIDTRDSIGDEKEGWGEENESERTVEIKTFPLLPLPAARIAGLAQLPTNITWPKAMAQDKSIRKYFSDFSIKTYIVCTQIKCLAETLLISTHDMFFWRNKITTFFWLKRCLIWSYDTKQKKNKK